MIQIKVTIPKAKFADKQWVERIADTMKNKTAPELKKVFRGTVFGWSEKPSFQQKLERRATSISMTVYTNNKIYSLVNAGSPEHPITSKRGGFMLHFKKGYRASTKPGSLVSSRKYRSLPWWTAQTVNHPGFTPRKFDELIAKGYDPKFREDMQDAFAKASKT